MTVDYPALPRDWSVWRVDRVASVNARIGWKALTASEYRPDGYVFLSTPNIKSEEIDFENVNYISEFRYEESPELKLSAGDVLLAKDGNTLGICNVVRTLPRPATVNGSIAVLRPSRIEPRFLRYVLSSSPVQEHIQVVKDGMGVPHLFQRDIRRITVPLPPSEEQWRIADFLDTETAYIDGLDALRARQHELLSAYLAARLDQAFTLRPDVPMVRLGYLATIQTGVTVDASRTSEAEQVIRPYLRVANVQAGYLDLRQVAEISVPRRVAAASTLRPGDVLMTEGGDLDKLGRGTVWRGEIEKCLHQNHVFAVRVDNRWLDADYLALLTQTTAARVHFESTGNKTTNLASTSSSKIRDFRIPIPSLDRQRAVVAEANAASAAIEAVMQAVGRQRELLAERRQALITAAVTGELDVTTASGAIA